MIRNKTARAGGSRWRACSPFALVCMLAAVSCLASGVPGHVTPLEAGPLQVGDPTKGAALAEKGVGTVASCVSCHGAHGEGYAASGAPRIAGQSFRYLRSQLTKYATGMRRDPIMGAMAGALTDAQRADVAAYYASLAIPRSGVTEQSGAQLLARGAQLAREGDPAHQVQACASCHGADGMGTPPKAPYLAGQSAEYLTAALKEWRDQQRDPGSKKAMAKVAHQLTEGDVTAVAVYFSRLTVR